MDFEDMLSGELSQRQRVEDERVRESARIAKLEDARRTAATDLARQAAASLFRRGVAPESVYTTVRRALTPPNSAGLDWLPRDDREEDRRGATVNPHFVDHACACEDAWILDLASRGTRGVRTLALFPDGRLHRTHTYPVGAHRWSDKPTEYVHAVLGGSPFELCPSIGHDQHLAILEEYDCSIICRASFEDCLRHGVADLLVHK